MKTAIALQSTQPSVRPVPAGNAFCRNARFVVLPGRSMGVKSGNGDQLGDLCCSLFALTSSSAIRRLPIARRRVIMAFLMRAPPRFLPGPGECKTIRSRSCAKAECRSGCNCSSSTARFRWTVLATSQRARSLFVVVRAQILSGIWREGDHEPAACPATRRPELPDVDAPELVQRSGLVHPVGRIALARAIRWTWE